jgi:hypothetical protein
VPRDGELMADAIDYLDIAASIMRERGATYDSPQGERSMAATVAAFNAITGHKLTEQEGWHFMAVLKMVRQHQKAEFHTDSAIDGVAYLALAAEAGEREG